MQNMIYSYKFIQARRRRQAFIDDLRAGIQYIGAGVVGCAFVWIVYAVIYVLAPRLTN